MLKLQVKIFYHDFYAFFIWIFRDDEVDAEGHSRPEPSTPYEHCSRTNGPLIYTLHANRIASACFLS
jgi:hypothetical protein